MNESCDTSEGVTSHVCTRYYDVSHSHVTHMYPVLRQWEYWCVTWAISHTCTRYCDSRIKLCGMSYVTYIYPLLQQTLHTYEWVTSHKYLVLRQSRHTYDFSCTHAHTRTHTHTLTLTCRCLAEWFRRTVWSHCVAWDMSHICTQYRDRLITNMNESCHTYKWVMSHKYLVLRQSHPTYEWVIWHKYVVPAAIPGYLHINSLTLSF